MTSLSVKAKKESGGNAYSDYDAPPVGDDSDFAELSDDDDELPF